MPLFRRKKKDDLEMAVTSDEVDPEAADEQVIESLRELGADLSKPRDTRFYLYVPGEADAQAAAGELRSAGYDVEVDTSASPEGDPWLVLASRDLVVDSPSIAEARRLFGELETRYRGEYDGWEAATD